MFIRIFPPKPDEGRPNFWVVYFSQKGKSQQIEVTPADEAEEIAKKLARKHRCPWKYQPNFPELPQWIDEQGKLREIDRLELVHLGNGRGQFSCFSGTVRLSVDNGDVGLLLNGLRLLAEGWAESKRRVDG